MNRLPIVLALALAFSPAPAAHVVDIDGLHPGNAYGNSANPDDGGNANGAPHDNVLNVRNSGVVTNYAYGAYLSGGADAAANGNEANVFDGGKVFGDVTGGYAEGDSASVSANSAAVAGSAGGNLLGGNAIADADAAATGNTAALTGVVEGSVYGGNAWAISGAATVSGNSAIVSSGGSAGRVVFGGDVHSDSDSLAAALDNVAAILHGGSGGDDVYGGKAENRSGAATASGNRALVAGSASRAATGGLAYAGGASATATNNTVELTGSASMLYGGEATTISNRGASAIAAGNTATAGGETGYGIYAGQAIGDFATTSGNHAAVVSGGKANARGGEGMFGGYAYGVSGAQALDNRASIAAGGQAFAGVAGGEASAGHGAAFASGNAAEIAGRAGGVIRGGRAFVSGGRAEALDNGVLIDSGGAAGDVAIGGHAIVNDGAASAAENRIGVAAGGAAFGGVRGGMAENETGGGAQAARNEAAVAGSAAAVFGGFARAGEGNAAAAGNRAIVDGGEVSGSVVGGFAEIESPGASAAACGNTVVIDGGKVGGDVAGGYVKLNDPGQTGEATGNTVILAGPARVGEVYGGLVRDSAGRDAPDSDAFTGNTLEKSSDAPVARASHFENVVFGYDGDAAIATLDTSPGAAAASAVKLDVGDHDIGFAGRIVGDGGLVKRGAGLLRLRNANDYTGGTKIEAGLVNFDDAANFGTGKIALDGGGLQWAAGHADDISGRLDPIGAAGGTFDTNGNDVTLAGRLSGGKITKEGAGALTLTGANDYGGAAVNDGVLKGNAASLSGDIELSNGARVVFRQTTAGRYDGVIGGDGALEKTGVGALTLTGANSHTGGTRIEAGQLTAASDSALGTGNATLENGATLGLAGRRNIANDIRLNGAAAVDAGADDSTLSGNIAGPGALTKTGAGTLTLTGANSYTGGTAVEAGTLAGDAESLQGDIENNATVIFAQAAPGEYAGAMRGSGALVARGAALTLSGENTHSGPTTVEAGSGLVLTGSLADSPLTVEDGAALVLAGRTGRDVSLRPGAAMDVRADASVGGNLDAEGATMNFYAPAGADDGDILLAVGGRAAIDGSRVSLGIDETSPPLEPGDSLVLIDAAGLDGRPANAAAQADGMQGYFRRYTFDLNTNARQLVATLAGAGFNPKARTLAEGYLSGLALVGQGLDGLDPAPRRRGVFARVDFGEARLHTGSRLDIDSARLLAGVTGQAKTAPGALALTAFFAAGKGSHATRGRLADGAAFEGRGHSAYAGLGALARIDFNASAKGRAWAEASAQAGRVRTDFHSRDLVDAQGRSARFDSRSAYAAAHVGAGYIWKAGPGELELYGKYFHVRRAGAAARLNEAEEIRFDAEKSRRLRIGGRYAWTTEMVEAYAGLAYEYEFDGRAGATARNILDNNQTRIAAPRLKGGSTLAEFGFKTRPDKRTPLTAAMKLQAHTGRRDAWSVAVKLEYRF